MDTPGPGGFVKLSQAVSTGSSVLSATEPHPIVSSGAPGAGSSPATEAVPEDSDIESVTGRLEKDSEEGEISDTETVKQNEAMNYRETVRAVRAFLGWSHINDFEFSAADGDRSDNPWKGSTRTRPGKFQWNSQPMTGYVIRWSD